METLIHQIRHQIRAAFADAAYPGDENLTDSFGDEADALIADFRGRTDWTVLTPDFLNQAPQGWGSALSFFSGAALQFYLPAYLIADLEETLTIGDAACRLCMFVTPQAEGTKIAKIYGGGTMGDRARQDFARFNGRQVSAILAYLWWKLDTAGYDPTIEQALEHYWLDREAQLQGSV